MFKYLTILLIYMVIERTFHKPVMITKGKQGLIYVPQDAIRALELEDRDELEITIKKTGIMVPRRKSSPVKPFGHEVKQKTEVTENEDNKGTESDSGQNSGIE